MFYTGDHACSLSLVLTLANFLEANFQSNLRIKTIHLELNVDSLFYLKMAVYKYILWGYATSKKRNPTKLLQNLLKWREMEKAAGLSLFPLSGQIKPVP